MTGHEMLVDRYAMRGILGRGGMAEVRDGWDTRLNRPVAIKVLHPALSVEPDVRRRFEDEARSAARLCHQNIVTVYDFGEHQGSPFIVLERLPGQTLADVIALGPMSVFHVRAMLDDVLAGLSVAHAAGVLHRDVKPGNILVSVAGDSMKVADFGIAKTGAAAHTMTGQIVGTMSYMSPERIAGAPASIGDDLYAVGLMGYEALVGRRLFQQDNPGALAHAIMGSSPPPVAELRSDADPVLASVIDRAITRNPLHRFSSADQMRAALAGDRRALLDGAAPVAVPPRPATKVLDGPPVPDATYYPPPPRRRRTGARRYGIAAGVLGALAVSAVALAMDPSSSAPSPQPVSTSTPVAPAPTVAPSVQQPAPEVTNQPGPPAGRGHGKKHG